jgi:hypothetical protein
MAANDTIEVYRGEDSNLNFTMSPVVDITGWTIEFCMHGSSGTMISKPGSIVDGPAGKFMASLTSSDTQLLPPGSYAYNAWRTDTGSRRVLAAGKFILKAAMRGVV